MRSWSEASGLRPSSVLRVACGGAQAVVVNDFDNEGKVSIHGEIWNALSDIALNKGQQVRVTDVDGLTLRVEPPKSSNREPS